MGRAFVENFFGEVLAVVAVVGVGALAWWAISSVPVIAFVVLIVGAVGATAAVVVVSRRRRLSGRTVNWRVFAVTVLLWVGVAASAYAMTLADR